MPLGPYLPMTFPSFKGINHGLAAALAAERGLMGCARDTTVFAHPIELERQIVYGKGVSSVNLGSKPASSVSANWLVDCSFGSDQALRYGLQQIVVRVVEQVAARILVQMHDTEGLVVVGVALLKPDVGVPGAVVEGQATADAP
ncbi:hypothetical protein DV737_g5755, partial [Chaetothyriales sp. CBS 132003]